MTSRNRTASLAAIILLAPLALALAQAPKDGPLNEEGIVRLAVTLKISPKAVAGMVKGRGVAFAADAAALDRLKGAGVPDAVVDAVREVSKKVEEAKTDPTPTVTFDQIAELVKLGVPDAAIRERVEGVVFTLSQDQADQLKKLGATDELIKFLGKTKLVDPGREITDLALLLDCSGSMGELTPDRGTKMDAAKKAATELIRKAPDGLHVAFIIYGHDRALACNAVKVVRPLTPLDSSNREELIRSIEATRATASTPIGLALSVAGQELAKAQGLCGVVLISDGKEMCNGNPVAEATKLASTLKLGFGVQVVGFGVKPEEKASLNEIAQAGKGSYYDAPTPEKLRDVALMLAKAVETGKKPLAAEENPPKEAPPVAMSPRIKALVDQLSDKVAEVRASAAGALEKLGPRAKAAGPALVERVADEIWGDDPQYVLTRDNTSGNTSKDAALKALRVVAPEKVEEALTRTMAGTGSSSARNWMAFQLGEEDGKLGNDLIEARAKALTALLNDKIAIVRATAAEALEKLGLRAKSAAPALAARVSDDLFGDDPRYVLTRDNDAGNTSKDAALKALKVIGPDRVEDALVRATKSKDEKIRSWATARLAD